VINGKNSFYVSDGALYRIALEEQEVACLVERNCQHVLGIVDSMVYYATRDGIQDERWKLERVPVAGGAAETVVQ
jgi:hypothetical protein